ncbi:MAG TPA: UvrD-helicase domain-containing protein [Anaerolineae bacterium]
MTNQPSDQLTNRLTDQTALTDEQRQAVTTQGQDLVVTAGAGSGKTRTLVGRYLSLLEAGLSPPQVAAVTFTEKAAREMRTRIRESIQRWLQQPDLDVNGRHFWESMYAEMDAAPIGTIHSLCSRILRSHPAEAALDPAFDVLDENMATALQVQAVEAALVWAANDEDAAALFSLLGEEGLRRAVMYLLQNRLDADNAFGAAGRDPLTHWQQVAITALNGFLDDPEVQTALADLRALQANGSLSQLSGDKLAQTIADCLAIWENIDQAQQTGNLATMLDELPQARRAMKSHLGRQSDWDDIDRPRQALTTLRDHYEAQLSWLFDKPLEWSLEEEAARALPRLHHTFRQALNAYTEAKTQRRSLDFDDLEAYAVELLESHREVQAYWQAEIRAVLVDEFQDTNDRQRRIVYALTDFPTDQPTDQKLALSEAEGTNRQSGQPTKRPTDQNGRLFVVGDAKQSIYRFRGADVTVFRRVQQNVADAGGAIVDLDLTFRAHAPLVEQLNALLAPIMNEPVKEQRPFAVPFAPLRAHYSSPQKGIQEPFVEFCLGVGDSSSEGRAAAAHALARRLWQLHDEEGIDWGQVGLLCRASTSFPFYENALEAAGIPFVTVAGRGFHERPEVRDLLNALRALAYPADDRALAGLLRSPAFALTDGAIYLLRRGDEEKERSLWAALHGNLSLLDEEDRARAQRAAATVTLLHDMVGRVPVARLLKHFLDLTHYGAILRAPLSGATLSSTSERRRERARRNVDKLLADAHASRLVSVGEFLEYVQTLRDVEAREGEAPVEAGEAVQLMTIHKAKGLEFSLVVIADASRRSGGRPGALLIDRQVGPVLKLRSDEDGRSLIYRLAAQRDQEQDEAEARRLLYVAATRARQKLLISGHVDASTAKAYPGKLMPKGWLGQLGAVVALDQQRVDLPLEEPCTLALEQLNGRAVGCTISPLQWPERVNRARKPRMAAAETVEVAWPPPLLAPVAAAPDVEEDERLQAREADPPPRVWRVAPTGEHRRGPAWVVGSLFHEALRRWLFPDGTSFASLMRLYAQEMGLTDDDTIEATTDRVAHLLRRFQGHPLFQQIAGARRYHEVPYTVEHEGRVSSRVIDVLYEYDGCWLVMDFKTDRLQREEALHTQKVETYRQQVREYVTAVRQLLGVEAQGQLCFLDVGGRVWVEPV